ncbi:MAG: ATP-dependent Clp protease ATP-binding subunit, partial [Hymenobacter sp.]
MLPSILLSDGIQTALHVAKSLAREYRHERYSAAHLLRALLQNDSAGASLLAALDKDVAYLRDWAEVRMEELPRVPFSPTEINGDELVNKVLEEANYTRIRLGLDQVHAVCV